MSAALLLALLAAAPDGGTFIAGAVWVDGGRLIDNHGKHWSDATWLQMHGWTECRQPIVYFEWRLPDGTQTWSYENPSSLKVTKLMMCRDDVPHTPPPCPVPGSIGCGLRYSVETALVRDGGQW